MPSTHPSAHHRTVQHPSAPHPPASLLPHSPTRRACPHLPTYVAQSRTRHAIFPPRTHPCHCSLLRPSLTHPPLTHCPHAPTALPVPAGTYRYHSHGGTIIPPRIMPPRSCPHSPVAVTGTPGIGISWFFYYLLARLLKSTEPPPYIVWEHMTQPGMAVRFTVLVLCSMHVCLSQSHAR